MSEELHDDNLNKAQDNEAASGNQDSDDSRIVGLSGLYESWFLDYASYVILERAVPEVSDGLKPVQRRILHSMKEMDDGRYNKVANIIGNTMKYHPHGDASIRDALVQLGQKDLLIDMQGNWGNIYTGDPAAAPRYIEARLSPFAREVVFNAKTTKWLLSYDGRNKEPDTLPIKFPLLLAQGVEGIAVGLASKILPHNFIELIDASIAHLQGKSFELFPDFITGGMADVSRYNDGLRGGKVRIRARISKLDKKTLIISELPFTTTTNSLIDSIIQANDKGKIKIKKIEDNTAEDVEILIKLGSGVSPDQTIDALYAFTNCEVSISPNSCIIDKDRPRFLGVKKILTLSTEKTVELLKMELEIRRAELMEQWHFSNLEKIFIQERIYRDIEEAESWDQALEFIDKGLDPFKKMFKREITREDIVRLTEIKIKRISKYNEFKAQEAIVKLEEEIKEVEFHLDHLVDYAINYYRNIKKKFGKGKERKTELRSFENIDAASVAVNNVKLYVNRVEGFLGTSLKKEEFLFECSDIDDLIVFRENGTFVVTKINDKIFVGKDIIHVGIFNKNDDRTVYNLIYRDGKTGGGFAKRFSVTSITRDKEYHVTKGKPNSKILYFSANPNGEAEIVKVKLRSRPKIRKLIFDYDFSQLAIKGRGAKGNTVSKYLISNVTLKEDGVSTLGARDIWYDETVQRLNVDERGKYLGAFQPEDKILCVLSTGEYQLLGFDLSTHFDENMIRIEKFLPEEIWSVIYFDGKSKNYYLKRFAMEVSERKTSFITDHSRSRLIALSRDMNAEIDIIFDTKKNPRLKDSEHIVAQEFIDVKSIRAKGKRLTVHEVKKIQISENIETPEKLDDTKDQSSSESGKGSDAAPIAEPAESKPASTDKQVVDKEEESGKKDLSKTASLKNEDDQSPDEKSEKVLPKVKKKEDPQVDKKKPKKVIEEKETVEPKKETKAPAVVKKKDAPKKKAKQEKKPSETDKDLTAAKEPKIKTETDRKEDDVKPKPKRKAKSKKEKSKEGWKESKGNVSLDSDEPLQMEFDF